MPWQERLKPAAYTSPSGRRLEFIYENVSRTFTKHTTAFDFPDADGTFVQLFGRSGRRFPLRVIFAGGDYDLTATQFDEMLDEDGVGILEHPMYGTFNVVPFGEIARRDDLKTRGNQAVYDITFYETNDLLFPLPETSQAQALADAIDGFLAAAPTEFEETLDVDSITEQVTLGDRYQAVVDQVKSGLQAIADVQAEIAAAFDTVFDAINDAIETFVDDPLTLAFQTGVLMQLPARSTALIADRLDAYGNLLSEITTNGQIYVPGLDSLSQNAFRNDNLFASNLLVATATSVLNNEFATKGEAISASETLLAFLDEYATWLDANLVSLGVIDTGASYQAVTDAMSTAAAFLVEISFTLKQERSVVLITSATPIELAAKYYKRLDDATLDFVIDSNALVGEEILEVPIGRRVVYYV